MKRAHGRPHRGDGTAWLVIDRSRGDYLCYWYAGTGDDRLLEQARAADASAAVAWGRLRTPRVRIRAGDSCTYWAGTAPRPEAFIRTWPEPRPRSPGSPAAAATPSTPRDGPVRAREERETAGRGYALAGDSPC
jgi:hypothetical protein